jgi:fluoride exporter
MNQLILIFLGGGLGSITRYTLGKTLPGLPDGLPYGTLTANVLASLILGIFTGLVALRSADPALLGWRAFVAVGFCGGFSTFSTFSNETLHLILNNRWAEAVFNIVLSVVLCLLASLLGLWLGRMSF